MAKPVTEKLAAELDDCIIENFADIYVLEQELAKLEREHDLDAPAVIAAIATCADVASAQQRLIARDPAALAIGLGVALDGTLRPSARLMVRALFQGAVLQAPGVVGRLGKAAALARELLATCAVDAPALATSLAWLEAGKPGKARRLPAFAQPERLPAPLTLDGRRLRGEQLEQLVRKLQTTPLAGAAWLEDASRACTPDSLARFARALAEGWLSHGAVPAERWGLHAAAQFPDDDGARALCTMAAQLAPRVGQFSKALDLVDTIAAMNTRTAMSLLLELTRKVRTRSVRDRARAAFDAAAARLGIADDGTLPAIGAGMRLDAKGKIELVDRRARLLARWPTPDDPEFAAELADLARRGPSLARDYLTRLERRMVLGRPFAPRDFAEGVLMHGFARLLASRVVFGFRAKAKLVSFVIGEHGLEDVDGEPVALPLDGELVVVHPLDLPAKALARWAHRVPEQRFAQLARDVRRFASAGELQQSLRALRGTAVAARRLFALEAQGWTRGPTPGGRFSLLRRELLGLVVELGFEPGVTLARGETTEQRLTTITVRGKAGSPIGLAEVERELRVAVIQRPSIA